MSVVSHILKVTGGSVYQIDDHECVVPSNVVNDIVSRIHSRGNEYHGDDDFHPHHAIHGAADIVYGHGEVWRLMLAFSVVTFVSFAD
jgi:hypothetical protein